MTDHCDSCPWRGCSTCEFQGGVDPNAPVAQRDSGATRRAKKGVLWENYKESGPRKFAPPEGLTTSPTKES